MDKQGSTLIHTGIIVINTLISEVLMNYKLLNDSVIMGMTTFFDKLISYPMDN